MAKSCTFINLFAGCGGLSLGLMQAGWQGLFAVEKDPMAFETLTYNLGTSVNRLKYLWPRWFPKKNISVNSFIRNYGNNMHKLKGKVDLVAGGPPCQGFSFAGKRKKHDPRNVLFRKYLQIVKEIRPKIVILENVKGISVSFDNDNNSQKKRGRPTQPHSIRICSSLEKSGYNVYSGLIKACEFGIPQLRSRYIIIGIRKDLFPEKKSINPLGNLKAKRETFLKSKKLPLNRLVSAKEAISDLEKNKKRLIECEDSPGFLQVEYNGPESGYQVLMHKNMNGKSPNSMRLVNHRPATVERYKRMFKNCRKGVSLSDDEKLELGIKKQALAILDERKPSRTLTTLPDDLVHYSDPRILTVRECARIQSFPDWYKFKGNYTTGGHRRVKECPRYTQVGNAVPPLLAEAIGQTCLKLLKEAQRKKRGRC